MSWPTAITLISTTWALVLVAVSWIEKDKPAARHCHRCAAVIEREDWARKKTYEG